MAWPIVAGMAVSAIGTAAASNSAKKAQQGANATNQQITSDTNAANYRIFRENRGAQRADGGANALLPEYFGDAERDIALGLIDRWKGDSNENDLRMLEDWSEVLNPAMEGGNQFISDIYSGKLHDDRLALADSQAEARRQGIHNALSETMGRLRARRMKGGLGGGSSFENNQMLGSAIPAFAQAGMLDADNRARIFDENAAMKTQMLDAPVNRVLQAAKLGEVKGDAQYGDMDRLMRRLSFFNMGEGRAPMQEKTLVSAVPGSGQIWGSALGSTGNALSNYFTNQQMISALKGGVRKNERTTCISRSHGSQF